VKGNHDHNKVGELLKNHPFALAEFLNAVLKGISGYHHKKDENQKSHNDCKPVADKPTEKVFLRIFLRELVGKVEEHQQGVRNRHERRRQSQSSAIRQHLVETRNKTRQRTEQKRQAKTVNRRYGRAFFRRKQREWLSPDVMVPNEKEKEGQIYEPGNNPLQSFI
jgi:hypothetical protein